MRIHSDYLLDLTIHVCNEIVGDVSVLLIGYRWIQLRLCRWIYDDLPSQIDNCQCVPAAVH